VIALESSRDFALQEDAELASVLRIVANVNDVPAVRAERIESRECRRAVLAQLDPIEKREPEFVSFQWMPLARTLADIAEMTVVRERAR
jgi:hypothetical protein